MSNGRMSFVTAMIPDTREKRVAASASVANSFGFGLVFSAMTLYFTRVLHLSVHQVGLGLAIAGLVGMLAGVPVGHLADIRGPREVIRVVLLAQVLVTISWIFIHGFLAFVVVASLELMCFEAYNATSGALLRRVGGPTATAFRSQVRALGNIAISVGTLGAGVAITVGTPLAYRTAIGFNAATFALAWFVLGFLPKYEPLPRPEKEGGPRSIAVKDLPFMAYVALAGAMSIQYWVISDPLPIWVDQHTKAPLWSVPAFFLINTVIVVLIQVRVGGKVETLGQGGRALRNGGLLFLLSSVGIGLASGLSEWVALGVLIVAVLIYSYGEVWFSSGQFSFEFGLPPEHAQGQYQGLAGVGRSLGSAAAPVLMIGLVLSIGTAGWIAAGVLTGLIGLTGPAIAAWGTRTRESAAAAVDTEREVEAAPEPVAGI